jgi:hypothetical protein
MSVIALDVMKEVEATQHHTVEGVSLGEVVRMHVQRVWDERLDGDLCMA